MSITHRRLRLINCNIKNLMRIGITGKDGFIGSAVAQALSLKGHKVLSLDRYTRAFDEWSFLSKACPKKLDWVLHFAANTSIKKSFKDPFLTYYNNLNSTLIALKIAHKANSAFLFMSSYVYGKPKYLPIDEKHPTASTNPYMGSKLLGEELCRKLSEELSIPLVILRGSTIYGDCNIPGRLISDLLESARKRTQIIINDPAPKRDYLYIKDLSSVILKVISQRPIKTGIYNVGYGKSFSNLEVAEMVRKLSKSKSAINVKGKSRPQEVSDSALDINLAKKTFSWSPVYPLEKGLKELLRSNTQK